MSDIELDHYITIRWDTDGELELDFGDLNHYEAMGVLDSCLRELQSRDPEMRVRFAGEDHDIEPDEEEPTE